MRAETNGYTKKITIPVRWSCSSSHLNQRKGDFMVSESNLVPTKWQCNYHVVFCPKYRRKVIYNKYRESLRDILKQLCQYKGIEILEGHLMSDYACAHATEHAPQI